METIPLVVVRPRSTAEPLTAAAIKKTQERIGSVAISPDGAGVTFETPFMRNKDIEIYYLKSDGTGEVRLSREIQPDWGPRFLTGNKVLAIKGERRQAKEKKMLFMAAMLRLRVAA